MLANPTYAELLGRPLPGMTINNPAFSGLPDDDCALAPNGPGYLDISPLPSPGSGYLDVSQHPLHDRSRSQKKRVSRGADYLDVHPVPVIYNAAFTGPVAVELDLDQFMFGRMTTRQGSSYTDEPVYACADQPDDADAGEAPAYTRMPGGRDTVAYQSADSDSNSPSSTAAGAGSSGLADVDVEPPACDRSQETDEPAYASLSAIGAELAASDRTYHSAKSDTVRDSMTPDYEQAQGEATVIYQSATLSADDLGGGRISPRAGGDLDIDAALAAWPQHHYDVAAAVTKSQADVFGSDHQDQADPKTRTRPEPDQVIYDLSSSSRDDGLPEFHKDDGFEDDIDDDLGGFEV